MENANQEINNPEQIQQWFEGGEWKMGWSAMPDASIDPAELFGQVHRNPERWEQAFRFLATTNLATLPIGRHELDGTNLYASVDEYLSREPGDCRLEAHRKYADIQYVISGQEQIGITPLAETREATPYHPDNDILFLDGEVGHYGQATPARFFVFFPSDAHMPCLKSGERSNVKKVVVKVRIG